MSTTFNTALTFEEVWHSLGCEWLPDDLRAMICKAIMRLPEDVADFATSNCSFIFLGEAKGETYPASMFTHITRRGRTMRNHWVINLKGALVKNESDGQFTVAHEIAHAWLGHQVMDQNWLAEEEADNLVESWGFQVPKYRLKVHAEYRRAMERSVAQVPQARANALKKPAARRAAKKGGAK